MKAFKLSAHQIRDLAKGWGGCIATDMITVEGRPVCWMYREEPNNKLDSGWRFFAGDEPDGYVNDSTNLEIYDVNTIANYDPDIIPFLSSPIGSAYERTHGDEPFREA